MKTVAAKSRTLIKTIIASYIVTAVLLLVLTLLVYKWSMNTSVLNVCIIITYFLSNLVGGIIIGKVTNEKKYIWGGISGCIYFIVLMLISAISLKGHFSSSGSEIITAFASSSLGGMLGGMIS